MFLNAQVVRKDGVTAFDMMRWRKNMRSLSFNQIGDLSGLNVYDHHAALTTEWNGEQVLQLQEARPVLAQDPETNDMRR
jgi:hypothetical protein